jgi:hypothetical protein
VVGPVGLSALGPVGAGVVALCERNEKLIWDSQKKKKTSRKNLFFFVSFFLFFFFHVTNRALQRKKSM